MWNVTIKGLLAKKLRFLATALAVVLGIGFMSGTLILTDTIKQTFDDLFASVTKGTDVVVRGEKLFDSQFGGATFRKTIPSDLVARVRAVPGIRAAEGGVALRAQIVGHDGKVIGVSGQGPPTFGFSWNTIPQLNPFELEPGGHAPTRADEVVIDAGSAGKGDLHVGEQVRVLTRLSTPDRQDRYTIVGIARFGRADSPAGATVTLFTLGEAQRISGDPNALTQIQAVGEPGVSQTVLRDRVAAALAGDDVSVITGAEYTKESQDQIKQSLSFFDTALLVFAAVALLVGIFIIYNSFSIIITQRTRELALLRAIGASGRQIQTSVMAESTVIGLLASGLGLLAGIALATGLKALLELTGLEIPAGTTVLLPRTVIASFVVGTLITVLSAILPARRAARVPPVAAMRDVAVETTRDFGRRTGIGIGIVSAGMAAILVGLFVKYDYRLETVGVGAVLIFLGVFVIGPVIARPVTRVIGNRVVAAIVVGVGALIGIAGIAITGASIVNSQPLLAVFALLVIGSGVLLVVTGRAAFTMVGGLARENALRNPKRTARTAAALMIGVSLVGFITIFGASTKASVRQTVSGAWLGNWFVTSGNLLGNPDEVVGFPGTLAAEIARQPIVQASSGVSIGSMNVTGARSDSGARRRTGSDGKLKAVAAIDTRVVNQLLDLDVTSGSMRDLGMTGIAVAKDRADRNGWAVGDVLRVTFTDRTVPLTIKGIFAVRTFSDFWVDQALWTTVAQQPRDVQIFIKTKTGVSDAEAHRVLAPIVKPYPNAKLLDRDGYIGSLEAQIDQFVNLIYAMLFLAVIISAIGIVNTLALSVFERTRELGLLRAVGMTRAQLRGSVRWEAVIIALFGTALGIVIGLFFGWAIFVSLEDRGLNTFAIAPAQLLIVTAIATVLGVFAGAWPAFRAARLDVLEAIGTE